MRTIKSRTDFERVFSRGRRRSDALLRIRVLSTSEGEPGRVAFVAAKRLGNAVFRNRCKRVLREAARMCGLPADGYDVILLATHKTHGSSPADVATALQRLLAKSGI